MLRYFLKYLLNVRKKYLMSFLLCLFSSFRPKESKTFFFKVLFDSLLLGGNKKITKKINFFYFKSLVNGIETPSSSREAM